MYNRGTLETFYDFCTFFKDLRQFLQAPHTYGQMS